VSYTTSDSVSTQCHGAKGLANYGLKGSFFFFVFPSFSFSFFFLFLFFFFFKSKKKNYEDGGISKLVKFGGLDALIFLCNSLNQELNIITTTALENFSRMRNSYFLISIPISIIINK